MTWRRKKKRRHNPLKPTFSTTRARKRAIYARVRPEVREARWRVDGGRCVFPTCRVWVALEAAHIHEVVNRSLGGDPLSVDETATLCGRCHEHMHVRIGGKLKKIEIVDGARRYFERTTGRDEWRDVTPPATDEGVKA